jgi:hypothetical protein
MRFQNGRLPFVESYLTVSASSTAFTSIGDPPKAPGNHRADLPHPGQAQLDLVHQGCCPQRVSQVSPSQLVGPNPLRRAIHN